MNLNEFITKFADAIEVENVNALTGETIFRDLEEWSSLSVMLLIAFYDEEFGKELNNVVIRNCTTINDLYKFAIA